MVLNWRARKTSVGGIVFLLTMTLTVLFVAPATAYTSGLDQYWAGTGSGGSIRCASSELTGNRQSSTNVTGSSYTIAQKDLYCVNNNSIPAGYVFAQVVIQEWDNGPYVTRVDDSYSNPSTNYETGLSRTCYVCNHSTKVVTGHSVNSLGAIRQNLMVSPIFTP